MKVVSLLFHDVFALNPAESGFQSPAADRYKLSVPEFEAQLDGLARAEVATPFDAAMFAYSRDCGTGFENADRRGSTPIFITFDDGGESYYSGVADRLEARNWRGHCFVSTDFIGTRGFMTAAQIRELDARGHVIGSHSASHPARFNTLTQTELRREWSESRQTLEDLLGHAVTVGSVPGGYFSTAVAKAASHAGLRVVFTSNPTTSRSSIDECLLIGRFTIRRGHTPDMAKRFVLPAPWARCAAWASWNAKAAVKPLLGPSYARVADWLLAPKASTDHG